MADVMCLVLAAGKGTRMKSECPKVLHRVCGRPMVWHVIDAVQRAGISGIWAIVGYKADLVREEIGGLTAISGLVEQEKQLGTGHAVRTALEAISEKSELTLIVYGDTPLLRPGTLQKLVEHHVDCGNALSILTARLEDPKAYGRILRNENGNIVGIVEQKDATEEQRRIKEINTGIYCVNTQWLDDAVKDISNDNAQGEFYLTDIVGLIHDRRGKVGGFLVDDVTEIEGVNDRIDLAFAQKIMEKRIYEKMMKNGVTIYHPESLYLEVGVSIEKDSVVYPNCSFVGDVNIGRNCVIGAGAFLKNVRIDDNARVGSGSYIENVTVPANAAIPPFAVLRG